MPEQESQVPVLLPPAPFRTSVDNSGQSVARYPYASKMRLHRRFLVIDSFEEMRLLVVRTLRRVFPQGEITEAHDFEEALFLITTGHYDAIVVHRAIGADAPTIIRCIRQHNEEVPIVSVSSIDRTDAVLAAGANVFLNFEEWLRVGTVVADLLAKTSKSRTRTARPRVKPAQRAVPSDSEDFTL